ncbi:MAG: hypothetical protein BWX57_00624 [Tenericutes bacterium ADurb.Bin024]|jgi:uncharacterized membrane protein|nr:DUF975 family protein [Bacillota bacterium]NLI52002.1 DUF975 family protein [Erysipelotrichaceae bacterium]OQC49939.1 MAG: hypothetical protein BWX57_00624 [Tenericutes bacterium ADurb.Bin024]HOA11345.1 DUF975 family protein [Bacilli bacterium]TAH58939.1 MAG: DUF975 family protein [Bacillota bacterium]
MVRKEIKQQAKDLIKNGKWFLLFVVLLIVSAVSSLTAGILMPVALFGLHLAIVGMFAGQEFDFNHFGTPFNDFNHALKVIAVYFLTMLIVMVGTMLFIIPGIIFYMMYVQAYRIMIEKPEIGIMDALRESKEMMNGYKMDYFVFQLSFIGHFLLIMITFGLWVIYLMPYFVVADTNYYLHLKQVRNEAKVVAEAAPVEAEVVE